MSWKGTLLLLATLGVAISALFLFSGAEHARSAQEPLMAITPSEVDRIVIRDNGSSVTLLKSNGLWSIEGDSSDRADIRLITSLLSTLASVSPLDVLPARDLRGKSGLDPLGLKNPKRSITVHDSKTRTLSLGVDGATAGKVYARTNSGSDVYLIPTDVLSQAFRPAQDFRDHRLTALASENIDTISMTKTGELQCLSFKRDPRKWVMESPLSAHGDGKKITDWLDKLVSAKVERWVVDGTDTSHFGFETPSARLSLRAQGESKPLIVTVGAPVPGFPDRFYVECSDRPGICEVNGFGTLISVTPESLRSRTLRHVEPDSVDRIEIIKGSSQSQIIRKPGGDGWMMLQENDRDGSALSDETVSAWFEALQGISASGFEPATPEKLRIRGINGQTRIRLIAHLSENTAEEGAGDVVLAEYTFGTPSGGSVAIREGASTDLLIVPEKAMELILITPDKGAPNEH